MQHSDKFIMTRYDDETGNHKASNFNETQKNTQRDVK